MRKRCYKCKCLEWESSIKFYNRTKDNPKARFYCKKCDPIRKERIKQIIEKGNKTRERKKEIKRFSDICRIQVDNLISKERKRYSVFNQTEEAKQGRRRYEKTDKGRAAISVRTYNRRTKYKNARQGISDEEKMAIGRFYRKCPVGCEVDHIIPISKGGRHEISNLQYLTREENRKKSAKLMTDLVKKETKELYPFTPILQGTDENDITCKKRNKRSKYIRMRKMVTK